MSVPKSKSIGRKRLIALADYVDKMRTKRSWRKFFDMGTWVRTKSEHWGLKDGTKVEVNNGCGTSACLLGHGVNVPALKKAGLSAVYSDGLVRLSLDAPGASHAAKTGNVQEICNSLFGVDEQHIDAMFCEVPPINKYINSALGDVTPSDAVNNMRRVIAKIDAVDGWTF